MKKRQWILINTLFVFLMSTMILSAQRGNDHRYDYNDDIVIVTDYNGPNYHNGDRHRPRGNSRINLERRQKENIMRRAYRIAQADGRITRRERKELNLLERDLGLNRRGHKSRRNHSRDRRHK